MYLSLYPSGHRPWLLPATLGSAVLAALLVPQLALAAPRAQAAETALPGIGPMFFGLVLAAFGIERVIELFWNYVEWILLNFRRWLPAQLKTAAYLQFKSGTSMLLGAAAGVGVASLLRLHLFAAVQPLAPQFVTAVPVNWDLVLTGLLLGLLTKPLHDLVELLAEVKNFMASAAMHQREAAGAALADGVLKLAQSDAQNMLEVPGLGPTRLSSESGTQGEGAGPEEATAADRYIDLLHNRTSI